MLYCIDHTRVELLGSESVHLEEALRLDLKGETKKLFLNRLLSEEENWISCDDIRLSSVLEEIY